MAYLFGVHPLHQLLALLLVEFHQDVGFLLAVGDKLEHPLGLFQIEMLEQFGYVGRVHSLQFTQHFLTLLAVDELFDSLYIFGCEFLHCSLGEGYGLNC